MTKLKWISSLGGPLVLMPRLLLPYWNGMYLPADAKHPADITTENGDYYIPDTKTWLGPTTDYGRACAIAEYVGLLKVGPSHAVVLGDEPNQIAWWPLDRSYGGILIRWVSAESEADVIHEMEQLPALQWQHDFEWEIEDTELVLLDASELGIRLENDTLNIKLPKGRYHISTVDEYGLTAGTALRLHRLQFIQ